MRLEALIYASNTFYNDLFPTAVGLLRSAASGRWLDGL